VLGATPREFESLILRQPDLWQREGRRSCSFFRGLLCLPFVSWPDVLLPPEAGRAQPPLIGVGAGCLLLVSRRGASSGRQFGRQDIDRFDVRGRGEQLLGALQQRRGDRPVKMSPGGGDGLQDALFLAAVAAVATAGGGVDGLLRQFAQMGVQAGLVLLTTKM
jgi:hypothetical protein